MGRREEGGLEEGRGTRRKRMRGTERRGKMREGKKGKEGDRMSVRRG